MKPRRARASRFAVVAVVPLVIAVLVVPAASAIVVNVNCNSDPLQPAIAAAPAGSTLKIKGTCHGNFQIQKNLTLAGNPTATLDGDGANSTVRISGFKDVHLNHLVITGGVADDGGGINVRGGGALTLDHVVVRGNSANGGTFPGSASGGGLFVKESAFVTVTNSTFTNNHVTVSGPASETASGGGIAVSGQLTITDSTISGNTVSASSTDNAGDGAGAGINVFGTLSLLRTKVNGNHADGQGPDFGLARGGGVWWVPAFNDVLSIVDSTINSNQASSSTTPSASSEGGGLFIFADSTDPVTIRGSTFDGNQVTANSSGSATAEGGAIWGRGSSDGPLLRLVSSTISNSSVSSTGATTALGNGGGISLGGSGVFTGSGITGNSVTIHSGSGNATGGGGGLQLFLPDPLTIGSSTIDGNTVHASSDNSAVSVGGGGLLARGFQPLTVRGTTVSRNAVETSAFNHTSEAVGGGLELDGTNTTPGDLVINSTIAGNTVDAEGQSAPDAVGAGVGVFDSKLVMRFVTIARNTATVTGPTPFEGGGGIYMETGTDTRWEAVVAALNSAATGPDCVGTAASDGFNLLGNATGCGFVPVASDQTNPTPKLGPLADNGGPNKTIALQTGSPALNRMPSATCTAIVKTDQRGIKRPQGLKCDEGAFERKP
jgi:hypothetical protein